MQFGKKITHESYFNGQLKKTQVEYSIPELVQDKSQALNQMMQALDLITTKQTHNLTVIVTADPRTHQLKMVTKNYVVEID